MDANVFIDLHGDCPGDVALETRQVMDSLSDRVDWVVTPELFTELNRREDTRQRQHLANLANSYMRLTAQPDKVDGWARRIESAAALGDRQSPQDRSDIRHFAWAAASGASIVLTRDRKATRRLREVCETLANIALCHPKTLAAVLHEREDTGAYAPAALAGTHFEIREISDRPAVAECFLAAELSERRADFDRRIQQLSAARPQSSLRMVRDASGDPAALIGASPDSERLLRVTLARLRRTLLEATVAAWAVSHIRQVAHDQGCSVMIIDDPHCPDRLRKALRAGGFVDTNQGLTGLTLDARIPTHELDALIRDACGALDAAQAILAAIDSLSPPAVLEHALRPLRLLDADLPTWIVPIQPQWASDLFGYPPMLMARDDLLGLGIEHVYYKKGQAGESAPGRILWYASQPNSEVFACSLLTEVRDARADDLFRRYQRLGVYKLADVQRCERRDGRARALNVTDTEILRRPVRLRRFRELAIESGESVNLQGARRISTALFTAIIREAEDP